MEGRTLYLARKVASWLSRLGSWAAGVFSPVASIFGDWEQASSDIVKGFFGRNVNKRKERKKGPMASKKRTAKCEANGSE